MKDWRTLGFVPDSEDEEELNDESQPLRNDEAFRVEASEEGDEPGIGNGDLSHDGQAGAGSAQGAAIEDADNGKEAEEDDLSEDELAMDWPSRSKSMMQSSARLSSPQQHKSDEPQLEPMPASSSLSSSLPDVADLLRDGGGDIRTTVSPVISQNDILSSPPLTNGGSVEGQDAGPVELVEEEAPHGWAAPQRNFRQRKPIQLNPYQILDGRYLQEMRSHGVRPTRVVLPPTAEGEQEQDSDSQGVENDDTQSVFASPPRPQPRLRTAGASKSPQIVQSRFERRARSSSPVNFDNDDLPDIETLLGHRGSKARTYLGAKRRKLLHSSTTIDRPQMRRGAGMNADNEMSSLQAPLSPASSPLTSQELPRQIGVGGFRFPPAALSPAKPPTPATSSSANKVRRRRVISVSVGSSPAPERSSTAFPEVDATVISDDEKLNDSASEQSQSEAEQNPKGIKAIQRRIRGVLPASWLKLDVKAQQKQPQIRSDQRRPQEPQSTAHQPGVARRLMKSSSTGQAFANILAISSDEDSEEETPKTRVVTSDPYMRQATLTQPTRMSSLFPDDDPGDIMEDNAVDFMLPTLARQKHTKRSNGRKRQTGVTDTFGQSTKKQRLHETAPSTSRASRHRTIRPKPPKLSILDAASPSPERSMEIPPFLAVARRQARRDPEHARHRPSQKSVRLQTREDTREVQAVLKDWHSGKIRRKATPVSKPSTRRKPLTPRDPNDRQSRLVFDVEEQGDLYERDLDFSPPRNQRKASALPGAGLEGPSRPSAKSVRRHRLKLGPSLQEGQLEAEEAPMEPKQDRLRFHQILQQENQEYATHKNTAGHLPRTLAELEERLRGKSRSDRTARVAEESAKDSDNAKRPLRRRRLRKLQPQQVDVETETFRQPIEISLPSRERSTSVQFVDAADCGETLQDLNPWGVPYPTTFDILPLPIGTYFHASTLVGSSAFKEAFEINDRDLDLNHGTHTVEIASKRYPWGPWSEELASHARDVLGQVAHRLTSGQLSSENHSNGAAPSGLITAANTLEQVLKANSLCLSFADPIDRNACAQVFLDELEETQAVFDTSIAQHESPRGDLIRLATRLATLLGQVYLVLKHSVADPGLRERCERMLRHFLGSIAKSILEKGIDEIRSFYDQNRRHAVREAGIKGDTPYVEAVVTVHHLCRLSSIPGMSFWDITNIEMLSPVETTRKLGTLEHRWYAMLSLLPLFEVGIDGVHQSGERFQAAFDNWDAVKTLMSRTLALYENTARLAGTTINDYVRALLMRCHHLISAWGWRRCEPIVSNVFDFFARRKYMSLTKEERSGSPRFLQQLAGHPSLNVSGDEKAFHIFLKVIGVGLQGMRSVYTEKQIRSIVWRWLPNHNHTYDKDKELRKEDLDALRNQHDLLSVLYWASPSSTRPRLQLVQDLVDHTSSHLEACRISIKTWSNLAAFQLSTDEPDTAAEPFAEWLKDILEQNIAQYKSARPELEAQHEAARRSGVATITTDKLETMISRNQSGIIAALTDAIAGLGSAFKTASGLLAAWAILRSSNVQAVLALFDVKNKKTNALVLEALSMFSTFLDLLDRTKEVHESQTSNEESQDYGDWPEEEDDAAKKLREKALSFVLEHMAHLLSTLFGSEISPADEVLTSMVDQWIHLALTTVRHKQASLDTYLSAYGKHSWSQLRDTTQRRKFGPYFLSQILKQDGSAFVQHRETFLSMWLCSLVERDAQLKYQHLLTSDLLNQHSDDVLFQNLPFAKRTGAAVYDISASDLRERRLGLLSSALSNMRSQYHKCMQEDPASLRALRAEYTTLLNHVMLQMRRNYEDLRHGDVVTGAYVTFVQTMIEFMQQYTTDICSIDRYFTDSSAFPLPAGDPTYLVGRLKGYDGKLHDTRAVKQLIMFMQNVSERAAVDHEQQYLVSQLFTVLAAGFGEPSISSTSLESVLFGVIFPAYIESAIDTPAAWLLARPVLHVSKAVFDNALIKISASDHCAARAIVESMASILSSIAKAVSPLEFALDRISQPHVISTLSDMLDVAATCVPTLDYVRRRNGIAQSVVDTIRYLRDFSLFAAKVIMGDGDAFPPTNLSSAPSSDQRSVELKTFCAQQLQQDLRNKWRVGDGQCAVKRGAEWRDIRVDLDGGEKGKLAKSIVSFHRVLDAAPALCD